MQTTKKRLPLSGRMQAILSMLRREVESGGKIPCVADVGCDHAFVSMACVEEGLADHVIAMDVRKGPLSIAQKHIHEYGFDKSVETRISDGFEALKTNEAQWAVIAGMGGELMRTILDKGEIHLKDGIGLILQPQSEIFAVRAYLQEQNYIIQDEDFIQEDGKFYTIIKAIKSDSRKQKKDMEPVELVYGPRLIHSRNSEFVQYLHQEQIKMQELQERLERQDTESSRMRVEKLREEQMLLQQAIACNDENEKR